MAPARICSASAFSSEQLPLPSRPMFMGYSSQACSIRSRFQGPGVQVVALVPSAGPVPPPIIGDWSPGSGYEGALRLLREDAVTAVFAANDQMAVGVLRAAAELGRSVPGDLSVVGYDDLDTSPYLSPALTSVHQDLGAVGRRCLEQVLAMIEDPAGPSVQRRPGRLVRPELIIRESTAAPRH